MVVGVDNVSFALGSWLTASPSTGFGSEVREVVVENVGDAITSRFGELVAEQGLGVFSVVAHEVRGPLMALGMSAELLAEDLDRMDRQQIRDVVEAMRARVLWMQGLVENLLCAAAIREGRFHLQPQPVDLVETLAEVQVVVKPLLDQRQQRLRLRLLGQFPEVPADSRRVSQVLVNLILNASKYSPKQTAIDVSLSRRKDALRVTVADRGPGLPLEGAARLFEPFYRAVADEDKQGLGLGLSIVKSIVDAHAGQLGAHNREGGGASFWFELSTADARPIREGTFGLPRGRRQSGPGVRRDGVGRVDALDGAGAGDARPARHVQEGKRTS